MTTALDTFGTVVTLNAVPITQAQDISGPGITGATEDTTTHSSVEQWAEVMPTIKSAGPLTFPLVYIPGNAAHEALYTALDAKTLDPYTIRLSDNSGWDFSGYVLEVGDTYPVAGYLARAISIQPSGKVTKVDPS